MSTSDKVAILSVIVTRDSSGRHFTSKFGWDDLGTLEAEGLITINRPVHSTGIHYDEGHWSVEVTVDGVELVEAYQEDCVAE